MENELFVRTNLQRQLKPYQRLAQGERYLYQKKNIIFSGLQKNKIMRKSKPLFKKQRTINPIRKRTLKTNILVYTALYYINEIICS